MSALKSDKTTNKALVDGISAFVVTLTIFGLFVAILFPGTFTGVVFLVGLILWFTLYKWIMVQNYSQETNYSIVRCLSVVYENFARSWKKDIGLITYKRDTNKVLFIATTVLVLVTVLFMMLFGYSFKAYEDIGRAVLVLMSAMIFGNVVFSIHSDLELEQERAELIAKLRDDICKIKQADDKN